MSAEGISCGSGDEIAAGEGALTAAGSGTDTAAVSIGTGSGAPWGASASVATCCTMSSPGTVGTAGSVAGSAAAMGLSARAAEVTPATAKVAITNRFLVRDMGYPIRRYKVKAERSVLLVLLK